jgi:hypothetical protein
VNVCFKENSAGYVHATASNLACLKAFKPHDIMLKAASSEASSGLCYFYVVLTSRPFDWCAGIEKK